MAPDFINKFHPLPYSVGACKKFCFAEKIFKRCGCVQVGDLGNQNKLATFATYFYYFLQCLQKRRQIAYLYKSSE